MVPSCHQASLGQFLSCCPTLLLVIHRSPVHVLGSEFSSNMVLEGKRGERP